MDISKHARRTELEGHQRNMFPFIFSQSYGTWCHEHYAWLFGNLFFCLINLSSMPLAFFFSFFFHITIQRKILESKEVLCFYSKCVRNHFFFSNIELSREGNSAGFPFTFRRLKENHDYDGQDGMRQSAAIHNAHTFRTTSVLCVKFIEELHSRE